MILGIEPRASHVKHMLCHLAIPHCVLLRKTETTNKEKKADKVVIPLKSKRSLAE
jgi:hypothetical protein